MITMYTM